MSINDPVDSRSGGSARFLEVDLLKVVDLFFEVERGPVLEEVKLQLILVAAYFDPASLSGHLRLHERRFPSFCSEVINDNEHIGKLTCASDIGGTCKPHFR
ncbi:hypothetical protein GCM10007919_40570 [Rhizobium indigoferae]|nr:hypothetical protein GCM10007919_40570 [Rhizobium indigoferae]